MAQCTVCHGLRIVQGALKRVVRLEGFYWQGVEYRPEYWWVRCHHCAGTGEEPVPGVTPIPPPVEEVFPAYMRGP